jgi:hypothetical protein
VKKTMAFVATLTFCAVSSVYADYGVTFKGTWPQDWPKELETLRKHAKTLEGPLAANQHYAIPFTKREEFEAAWPHLLKVKSKGASIVLVRGPNFFLGENVKAGVVVHTPPTDQNQKGALDATYIELVVDGEIVDLNRIALPPDTPINDRRFKDEKQK